jgi:23S rRNA (pseudouridine1915-N3)-methyltransferase
MRNIRLVCIGRIKERYLQEGIAEYEKRLHPYCKLEIIELKDEGIEKEAKRLEKYLSPATFILDANGKELDSIEFSNFIKRQEGGELTFIIGSAQGVDGGLKSRSQLISLSKMTFTHEMCRLFLIEQLYRSFQILANRPYHK